MPRATVTVSVVRNPMKLAKVLNDQQLQISAIRVMCDSICRSLEKKKSRKEKKCQTTP